MAPYWNQEVLLHDHLAGSFPLVSVLPQLFQMSGKEFPFNKFNCHLEVKKIFQNPQIDIVKKFSNITGVMQSRDTLALAAEACTRVRARQGFGYCEVTAAPQYYVFGGLKEEEVIAALVEGIKRGEEQYPEIEVNLLFTVGREVSSEEGIRLVESAARCDRNYVVGIGLACDEANHPPQKHIPLFRRAKELGFKTTVHAGEWVNDKPNVERDEPLLLQNVLCAIFDLGADRISHAIPLAYSPDLVKIVVDKEIGVEGCPGSNLASGLIPNVSYLKIRKLLGAGVLYSLNPDDDLFLPDLNETFALCDKEYNFTDDEKRRLKMNAWATRFGRRKSHGISPEVFKRP